MSSKVILILTILIIIVLILTIASTWVSKHHSTDSVEPDRKTQAGQSNFKPFCESSQVACDTSEDCIKCAESAQGFEMKCVQIPKTNDPSQKFGVCVPATAKLECSEKYGGVPAWSGWSDASRMEWDCLCNYPEWSETPNCNKLNADICQGGTFDWDLTKKQIPEDVKCTCPSGMVLVMDAQKKPRCFSPETAKFYQR